ncbi:protein FAM200C-like [Watersipora subatra]|uniref:protein FAM200C-like n=1 Tax=Watersipora subatra TaxID=2589382 RepID=UPI00355BFE69
MSTSKKRKHDASYMQYGFQCLISNVEGKPQCVLCMKVLGNDSMRPNKLKHHLSSVHPQHTAKDQNFFERHGKQLRQMRLDTSRAFHESNSKLLEASYKVAYEIANQKKPHTIIEDLTKPCTLMMTKPILGKEAEKKLAAVSLSNNTVQGICNMANDIKDQVVHQIRLSPFGLFAIHLDESTDVASCSQLMVYARCVHNEEIKEEFLFCVLEISSQVYAD